MYTIAVLNNKNNVYTNAYVAIKKEHNTCNNCNTK